MKDLLEQAASWIESQLLHTVGTWNLEQGASLVSRLRAAARPVELAPKGLEPPFPRMRLVVDISKQTVRAEPGDDRTAVWLRTSKDAFSAELFGRVVRISQARGLTEEVLLELRAAYLAAVVAIAPVGSNPVVEVFRRG